MEGEFEEQHFLT